MNRTPSLLALALLFAAPGAPGPLDAAEEGPRPPRGRRANGTMVVRPTEGSLPDDGRDFAPSAVPLERGHYLHDPEWMDAARREAFVDPDVPVGFRLGRPVGTVLEPMVSRAPARQVHFDGLNRETAGFLGQTGFPPDTIVSVSPTKVIQATNLAMLLTDRTGNELDRVPLNNFFGHGGGDSLFDPKVYFDRLSGRFFLVALEQDTDEHRSGIWLGVSKGSDPTALSAPDQFCTYRIQANRGGSWADYPLIGVNENWFAVAVNNFFFDDFHFKRPYIYVLRVQQLVANSESCPPLTVKRFDPHNDAAGVTAFNIHPAQHYTTNALPGKPLFLVSSTAFVPASHYTLWRITTTAGGQPQLSKHSLDGGWQYFVPPAAPQRGGEDLDAGDWRITQVAYRDGKVWAVHGTACAVGPLPNEACVRAVEFTPNATSGAVTFSETFGRPNTFLFWPGVAINANGDVAMAYQRSKAGAYLGTVFNGKRANAMHFDVMRNLRVGNCSLDNFDSGISLNRTGDYVGLQTDPLDDLAFWVSGEYPGGISAFRPCDWRTRIGRVKY